MRSWCQQCSHPNRCRCREAGLNAVGGPPQRSFCTGMHKVQPPQDPAATCPSQIYPLLNSSGRGYPGAASCSALRPWAVSR